LLRGTKRVRGRRSDWRGKGRGVRRDHCSFSFHSVVISASGKS
jgi:hypothetical protein